MVIAIKLEPLGPDDSQIQRGFIQIYSYDHERETKVLCCEQRVSLFFCALTISPLIRI
jgi:hypothetical protein